MAAIDDFKAEYSRQHPGRPPLKHLSDEGLVWAELLDRQNSRVAKLEKRLFDIEHQGCDH